MLASITRQYKDLSTADEFLFAFYCDRCGREWKSDIYVFNMNEFEPPVDKLVRSVLWNQQHAQAYERANCEAVMQFSRCPSCGSRICDDCLFTRQQSIQSSCKDCN